jgi:hypothetical protein
VSGVKDTARRKTSLGWMLLGLLGLQLGLAAPMAWALDSYFNVNVPASLMFFGKDGWCDIDTEGVGRHCFGDFHERFLIDPYGPQPWANNLEMSPIGPVITGLANWLATIFMSRFVLAIFILIYAACLIAPAIWASRRLPWPLGLLVVGITGVATYPFLATMDRLNNVALTVPLILVFLVALSTRNRRGILISVLALTVIKPQFIVLYLVLVAHRQIRVAVVGVLASTASCLALVVGAGGGDFGRITQWLAAISGYGSGVTLHRVEFFTPINVSFSRLIFLGSTALESLQQVLFGGHAPVWAGVHLVLIPIQTWLFILAAVILAVWGGRIPPVALGVAALVLSSLVLGEYVAAYYLSFALPVCALFLRRASPEGPHHRFELEGEVDLWAAHRGRPSWLQLSALLATVFSCSLLIVPLPLIQELGFFQDRFHRVSPIMQNLATASWLLFLCVACGVALRSALGGNAEILPTEVVTTPVVGAVRSES